MDTHRTIKQLVLVGALIFSFVSAPTKAQYSAGSANVSRMAGRAVGSAIDTIRPVGQCVEGEYANDRILFLEGGDSSYVGLGGSNLYTIRPNGDDRKKLTDYPVYTLAERNPYITHARWSHQGNEIAYTLYAHEEYGEGGHGSCFGTSRNDIHLIKTNGDNDRNVTGDLLDCYHHPTFSPDDDQLAFYGWTRDPEVAVNPVGYRYYALQVTVYVASVESVSPEPAVLTDFGNFGGFRGMGIEFSEDDYEALKEFDGRTLFELEWCTENLLPYGGWLLDARVGREGVLHPLQIDRFTRSDFGKKISCLPSGKLLSHTVAPFVLSYPYDIGSPARVDLERPDQSGMDGGQREAVANLQGTKYAIWGQLAPRDGITLSASLFVGNIDEENNLTGVSGRCGNLYTPSLPSWAPGSRRIVFSAWQEGDDKLFVLDTETLGCETIARGRNPKWSPLRCRKSLQLPVPGVGSPVFRHPVAPVMKKNEKSKK